MLLVWFWFSVFCYLVGFEADCKQKIYSSSNALEARVRGARHLCTFLTSLLLDWDFSIFNIGFLMHIMCLVCIMISKVFGRFLGHKYWDANVCLELWFSSWFFGGFLYCMAMHTQLIWCITSFHSFGFQHRLEMLVSNLWIPCVEVVPDVCVFHQCVWVQFLVVL